MANTIMDAPQSLVRLTDAHYEVAPGKPDIRGWDVILGTDDAIGEVDDLVIDSSAGKVRYLDVELDRQAVGLERARHVLIPIEGAELDTSDEQVVLNGLSRSTLLKLPEYDGKAYMAGYDQTFRSHLSADARTKRATHSAEQLQTTLRPVDASGQRKEIDVNTSSGNVLFRDEVKHR